MIRKLSPCAIFFLSAVTLALAACSSGGGNSGGSATETPAFGLSSQVVTSADHAARMVWAPDGRLFFAEQYTGNIRIIQPDGTVQADPFATLQVANYLNLDWGLTGIALDPKFATNHYVYAFYSDPVSNEPQPSGPTMKPKLVRFTDSGGKGIDETTVSDDFPVTPINHPGYNGNGAIHFGPDGYLYLSIGDYDFTPAESKAQDLSSPVGKLLRIDSQTGKAAAGNPFAAQAGADARIFAYGFRVPFDFIFHPKSGAIYGTDDTTVTCEELNVVAAGGNYGWATMGDFPYANCAAGKGTQPIYNLAAPGKQPGDFLSFLQITGVALAPATQYPQMGESLVVCGRYTGTLERVVLSGPNLDKVTSEDIITKGCKWDVAVSPEGTIYYSTETEIDKLVTGQVQATTNAVPQIPGLATP